MTSLERRTEEAAKLREFLAGLKDGEEVLWVRIEFETGVAMTMAGRELVRRSLRRLKRPYEALRGEGVRLSSPGTSMTIMRHRFVRIDNAVHRADKTRAHLAARHFEQLSPADQRRMTLLAGFFGTIRAIAKAKAQEVLR